MATRTISLDEAIGTQRPKVQLNQPSKKTVPVLPQEDGPERIIQQIEEAEGITFSPEAKARAIQDILDGTFTFTAGGTEPVKKESKPKVISLEDAIGVRGPQEVAAPPPEDEGFFEPLKRTADKAWEFISSRVQSDFGQIDPTDPRYNPGRDQAVLNPKVQDPAAEEIQWRQRIAADPAAARDLPKYLSHLAPQVELHGFIANLENPLKLMTEDSLPANFLSFYANLPKIEQRKFDEARKVMMQQNIAMHPDKFPPVSVEAARKAIQARIAKQDPTVRQQWTAMFDAATEDPGRFGGQLVNSIVADPELLFAPVGLGTRVAGRSLEIAGQGAKANSRVIKLADRIMDAGSVAAAMNTAISAQDQLARGSDLSSSELKLAAGMGAAIGGPLGVIFTRGARAKVLDLDAERLKGTIEDTLRERAAYDVEVEAAYRDDWRPETDTPMQKRIQEMLGITRSTDRDAAIQERRKAARAAFKNEADYADYLKFKAEERIARAEQIRAESDARASAEAAQRQAAEAASDVRIPSAESPEGVPAGEVLQALRTPDHLRTPRDGVSLRALRDATENLRREIGETQNALRRDNDTIEVWRAPNAGLDAPTEGVGMYASLDKSVAEQFGDVESFRIPKPKNELTVNEEPMYGLHELDEVMEPIQDSDSVWTKLNKQAAQDATKITGDPSTSGKYRQWSQDFGVALTARAKELGYDAFNITSGGDNWHVIFDGHKNVVPKDQLGKADPAILRGLGITAAAGVAGASMFPQDRMKGALAGVLLSGLGYGKGSKSRLGPPSKISQEGAIRLKGEGEWSKITQDDMAWNLAPSDVLELETTIPVQWAEKAVKTYLNKYAGTAEDPLKDIILPDGDRWEDIIDQALKITKNSTQDNYPYVHYKAQLNIPENVDKPIFDLQAGYEANNKIMDYLAHVGDYIMQEVPAAKLPQYDLVRAVKETAAWDAANLKKAEKARAKVDKNLTVVKTYDDGTRWVKLDKPGQFAAESDIMGHSVRGYEPPKEITEWVPEGRQETLPDGRVITRVGNLKSQHPDWIPESGDSGHKHYGHGGWEAIKSGKAEIYSLRDKEGRSHVTIEVDNRTASHEEDLPRISQIKGKGNAKPAAKYIPYIQDFVKSGKWEGVGDARNADIFPAEYLGSGDYEILQNRYGRREYYTLEELTTARNEWNTQSAKSQRGSVDPELLAKLGVVGLGAAAGAALAPEDRRLAGGFFGALTAFALPKGGNIARKMYQSGAISADGDIVAALVKAGKLLEKPDMEAARVIDGELAARAAKGDQVAQRKLYEANAPRLRKAVAKYLRVAGPKLGIDADDIVQEAFISAFRNIENFDSTKANFYTWLHKIAENKGLNAVRDADRSPDTVSMYNPSKDTSAGGELGAGHILEGDNSPIKASVEGQNADFDTPENVAVRDQVADYLARAINKLPPQVRDAVIKSQVELKSMEEIAQEMGIPANTVQTLVWRAKEQLNKGLAEHMAPKAEKPKVPRTQRGEADPRLLKLGALAALGAGAGAYLNEQNKLAGAGIGAALAVGLAAKGKKGTSAAEQIVRGVDYTTGLLSTRIKNISEPLWMRMLNHERVVLRDTHKYLKAVDPFLVRLESLSPAIKGLVQRAILTGDHVVTQRLLQEIGDPALIAGWKAVRSTLDSIGDQLVHLRRFKNKETDYFPRIVKDVPGLLRALGKDKGTFIEQALHDAEAKAIKNRGTGLTDLERSLIINKILRDDRPKPGQPGYAKNRVVEEITPELQQYYASPAESLHSYIRAAVEDIERARFFGRDLEVVVKAGKEYTNTDQSIGKMVDSLMRDGKLDPSHQADISSMLKSRFINGERTPAELVQAAKNLSTAGLLGNPISAATQLGDTIAQFYVQDIRSTLQAVVRNLTGRKIVSMRDFGLADHIAEEFVSTSRSTKFLNTAFKLGLFKAVDEFGKNIGLNAAVIRASRLAKTEKGVAELARKYAAALGPEEFKQWIKDLQKGEKSDLVNQMAFVELSRSQPITRIELPQAYLDNPNGRVLYQFKTFMLKQIDLARRDGYAEIKAGNVARGIKNLTMLGLTLGVAGMTTQQIKNFLLGRDVGLKASDIPMNALKTFGLTQYFLDQATGVSKEEAARRRADGEENARAQKASPAGAMVTVVTPPVKMFDDIVRTDPKAWRYVPVVGPLLYEHVISEDEK